MWEKKDNMKKRWYGLFIISIILIGFFLRVYKLDKTPPSVNFDEAALGYNAFSILKTGKDEYGNFLPLSLRSFNDYKPALYAYLSIPFIAAMGLNDVSIRMVSAIAGTVSLIFLYFFLKSFIKNKYLRIFIFIILSLEPWRLHFSRVAFEANLSASFFIAGAWYFYKYRNWKIQKAKILKFLLVSVLFALSAYSYHSARVAVPLFTVFWALDPLQIIFEKKLFTYIKWVFSKRLFALYPLLLFILLILPVFLTTQSTLVLTRFKQENIFDRYFPYAPKELIATDNAWLNWQSNPVYYFMGLISGHVLSYFSPINTVQRIFHWIRGSVQYIPGFSMFGWLESIIFIFGLVYLIKNIKKLEKYRFVLYWIIAGAAPAAVTWNWFHPLRSLNIFPALEIVIAIGFLNLYKFAKNNLTKLTRLALFGGLSVVFALTIIFTVCNEYNYSISENNGEYQPGGFKEGMQILKSMQDNYDQVIIDSPHAQSYIFLLFYQSFPPEIVQRYAGIRPKPGIEGNLDFNFDKFVFKKFDWPVQKNEHKTLIWTSSEVKEDEIKNTPGAKIIWVNNAVMEKATAIISKD